MPIKEDAESYLANYEIPEKGREVIFNLLIALEEAEEKIKELGGGE